MDCEPNHKPVLLCENSEVCIVPKDRYQNDTMFERNMDVKKKKPDYLQFQFLRNFTKPDPYTNPSDSDESYKSSYSSFENHQNENKLLAIPYNLLTSWFSSPKDETDSMEEPESLKEIYQFNFDSVLRVLPYTNPIITIPTVVQATTVFISESTYVACCGNKEIPPCFVGLLRKYSLPEKKSKKSTTENGKNVSEKSSLKNIEKNGLNENERQRTFNSLCVTVIIIKCDEDEFTVPPTLFIYKNAIVVPKEIKRALNLEVGCLVQLKSMHEKPLSSSYRIIFHPVTTLVSYKTFFSFSFSLDKTCV